MSAGKVLGNLSKSPAFGYAILGIVGIVGFIVVKNAIANLGKAAGDLAEKATNAAGAAGTAVIDTASNIATGNTATAHGTPYEGKGIFGSLGLATDKLFGGGLSEFGGWIGDSIYDATHSDDASAGIQHSTGNPYGGGPTAYYSSAVDQSPVAAQYAANPNAQAPYIAPDFGLVDSSTWEPTPP